MAIEKIKTLGALLELPTKQHCRFGPILRYCTRAIITRSRFETALDYKPRILGPTFLVYVLKWSVILTSLDYKPH